MPKFIFYIPNFYVKEIDPRFVLIIFILVRVQNFPVNPSGHRF